MIDLDRDIDAVAAAAAVGQLQARMTLLPVSPSSQHPAWLDPKEASYLKWIGVGKTKGEAGDGEPARKPIHPGGARMFQSQSHLPVPNFSPRHPHRELALNRFAVQQTFRLQQRRSGHAATSRQCRKVTQNCSEVGWSRFDLLP